MKILFIDRDGTLIEEPADEQVDSFEKLVFKPGVFNALSRVCTQTDFRLVLVSNQDGLGTETHPEENFWPVHHFVMDTLAGEGICFDEELIDPHRPEDNSPMRKPGTGMLTHYINNPEVEMADCFVIGDRETDRQLAENLGCGAFILSEDLTWKDIADQLTMPKRLAEVCRKTSETDIRVAINLDGRGDFNIHTGIGFFDHMLEQISRHGLADLEIDAKGDLHVDEHHTIEDTAIVLGQAIGKALGDKRGIDRYGYCLPMDDCLCQVAIDFGGRPWLQWDVELKRERVGDMPTEMVYHFFKSLSDSAQMNLAVKAEGINEHHKIEAVFKAFARALRMAVRRDERHRLLPSTKGML